MNETMTMPVALGLAAQCWCDDETAGIEMDERLAGAFAKRLLAQANGDADFEAMVGTLQAAFSED